MSGLEDYAPLPRWVGWRNATRGGSVTKVPYDPKNGAMAEANDPTTWATRASAEAWAARNVNGQGGGVGIELGDLGDGMVLCGVDLDTCRDNADGTLTQWALDCMRALSTYTEVSPSGTGAKAFFLCDAAALPMLREAMGKTTDGKMRHGKMWKQGAGKHAPGIELHVSNRYFAVTGDRLPDCPDNVRRVDATTLLHLIQVIGPSVAFNLSERIAAAAKENPLLAQRWGGDWSGVADQSRSGKAFALCGAMKGAGFSKADTIQALREHRETAEWAAESGDRELLRTWTNSHAGGGEDADGEKEGGRQAQRDRIVEAVLNTDPKFWRDPDGHGYATMTIDGRTKRFAIRSRPFKLLVRAIYGAANPNAKASDKYARVVPGGVSDTALAEALPTFEAIALSDEVREPATRVWRDDTGTIWIDLGDETWRLIQVTASGWQVIDAADVPLIRPDGMRALPLPERRAESLADLSRLLTVGTDQDFRLVVAWLLAALALSGPYPVLALDGEQGSGKSTFCKVLRRLIDPNAAELRAMPRGTDDLLIAARNGRVIVADNVSHIDADMADALCRVATGGGLGKRALFTDGDEVIVHVCRPVLLNGIPSLLARGDLADRSIAITLPAILDAARRPEADLWADFDRAAPGILALLLDALATALRNLPTVQLSWMPRMADFARLACAAAPAFGWTHDDILKALRLNRESATDAVIEADPVAEVVRTLAALAADGEWEGTATELLERLGRLITDEVRRDRSWPRNAARLSNRLTRAAPGLRRIGVIITTTREGNERTRTINITQAKVAETASASSASSATDEKRQFSAGFDADATADATELAHRPQNDGGNQPFFDHADAADDADADFAYAPPQSGAPEWEISL